MQLLLHKPNAQKQLSGTNVPAIVSMQTLLTADSDASDITAYSLLITTSTQALCAMKCTSDGFTVALQAAATEGKATDA